VEAFYNAAVGAEVYFQFSVTTRPEAPLHFLGGAESRADELDLGVFFEQNARFPKGENTGILRPRREGVKSDRRAQGDKDLRVVGARGC
jgi:hypothetical protein